MKEKNKCKPNTQEVVSEFSNLMEELSFEGHDLKEVAFLVVTVLLRGLESAYQSNDCALHPVMSAIAIHVDDKVNEHNNSEKLVVLNDSLKTLQ